MSALSTTILPKRTAILTFALFLLPLAKQNMLPSSSQSDRQKAGLAAVKKDGKWGYVGKSGSFLIEPHFEGAESFSEGLAAVKVDKKWGYIDPQGGIVFTPAFDFAPGEFSEGLALVLVNGECNYIDKTGAVAFHLRCDETLDHFLKSRAEDIALMKSTPDLREHLADSPFGQKWDAYEFLLFGAAHSERHTKQINEVKADPNFPKN